MPPDRPSPLTVPATPPSIGGSAMAAVSGMWMGSNLAPLASGGALPPLSAWAPPLVLLLCVVLLLGAMQLVRARLGAAMPPAARRRQQLVVAAALGVGLVAGFAFSA